MVDQLISPMVPLRMVAFLFGQLEAAIRSRERQEKNTNRNTSLMITRLVRASQVERERERAEFNKSVPEHTNEKIVGLMVVASVGDREMRGLKRI